MKQIHTKFVVGAAVATLFLSAACSKILEEQPRSIYEPGYFSTPKGVQGGLTAMYAHLRYFSGTYFYIACQTGTDETTWGQNSDSNNKDIDFSQVGTHNSSSSRSDVIWNEMFPTINTASGVIENAAEAGISESLIAEARFFRAFDYFMLVQTFGGVPLDLGAGELKFNSAPVRISVRNTVPEVYTKAVFPDLLTAINDLPDAGRVTGGATKTLARFYLAKAYLTYGWWLENPGGIPTYPECPRVDPDGHDAQWYFQQAYNVATTAIDNPGPFGLLDCYYDVHLGSNDRNKEILLYADRTESSEFYNGSSLSYANSGNADNTASWWTQWNYTEIYSAQKPDGTSAISSVQREAAQSLGRPWTGMVPPLKVFTETFANKTEDSRYDGTFVTVYRGNWKKNNVANDTLYNANNLPVFMGDAILTFLSEDPATPITYSTGAGFNNVGAGTLPDRADWVISPSAFSRRIYPGLWKTGPYRTDNGSGLGQPNGGSTRPFNIARFAEFYLIAAEAAVKGAAPVATKSARELVNELRARAGKWRWDNNGDSAKVADHSAALTAATPDLITIDYILEERSREFFGEGLRWYDLVRTQKWIEKAQTYQICGVDKGDRTLQTITRDMQTFNYLRPIPRGQLEALEMTPAEKRAYQNPGYTDTFD
ncbi:MAG: RagB/SusD family nutrient uptake outer membrane protein [Prevotellaceae bacterium]|jgi:hypothetical protein|nr:RagB/SusD family nutrient uptake outer membrane protein [Prevotellaceae bacterium]